MTERALITGASGLLGSALLPQLEDYFDLFPLGHRGPPQGSRGAVVDLADASAVAALVREVRPGVVLHLAALADVDACEREPDRAHAANVGFTRNVAAAAAALDPVPYVVYVSTDHVYDAPGANREEDTRPRNVYALTKLWGEDVACALPGAAAVRLNFFSRPGGDREGLAGWILRMLAGGDPVQVFTDVRFSPIYAGFLGRILRRLCEARPAGVFNLGSSGDGLSKADFACRLAEEFGLNTSSLRRTSVEQGDLLAYRPRGMVMDVSRIQDALGIRFPGVDEGIKALHATWNKTAGQT